MIIADPFGPASLVVLLPLIAAVALALIPAWTLAARVNIAASALTFLLACRLPFAPGRGVWLSTEALAVHVVLLTSFIGLTTAWFSASYVAIEAESGRLDARGLRWYHAAFQALLGFLMLALLSDNTGVTLMAMEAALFAASLATAMPRTAAAAGAAWQFFILCGLGIALALFGTIMLYLAALPALGPGWQAMRWSALLSAAGRCNGAVLNLAFVFLLVGYATKAALAPFHAWLPDTQAEGPTPISAMLTASVLNVALVVILRLRNVLDANAQASMGALQPGPLLAALGLVSLLLAAFGLWRRRDVKRFFALSVIGQNGIVAFAFGLGGPLASFAGLLHMTLYTLAKAAIFQCIGRAAQMKAGQSFAAIGGLLRQHRALGLTLAGGIVAIAGLPPFGLFASEFLIVAQTLARAPVLAVPLGIGLAVCAWALVACLQALCLGDATPDHAPTPSAAALAPAWLHLIVVVLLGVAMPGFVLAWMQHATLGVP